MNEPIPQLDSLSLDDQNSRDSHRTKSLNASSEEEESIILDKTSNLSISDPSPKSNIPSISPFHRHYPSVPSPLRTAYTPSSLDNDVEMLDSEELEASDLIMEDVSDHDESFTEKFTKTTSLILSPTILGARVATSSPMNSPHRVNLLEKLKTVENDDSIDSNLDTDEDDDTESNASNVSSYQETSSVASIKQRNKPTKSSSLSKYVVTHDDEEDTTIEEISTEFDTSVDTTSSGHFQTPAVQRSWGNQPIQLQMHHHHYYPPTPSSAYSNDSESLLPAPWSKAAKPKAPAPYLISSYLQLLFNAITSGIILYILISAIKTVRSDINAKIEEHQTNLIIEIQYCSKSYYENKCQPETRVAALERMCIDWERCMNRDPNVVASKSSVSAETLGIILNSLIEPIGAKAIVVFVLGFIVWSFTSNFIFGFVRAKSYYGWSNSEQQQQHQQEQQQQLQGQFNQTPMKAIQLNDNNLRNYGNNENGIGWSDYSYTSTPSK